MAQEYLVLTAVGSDRPGIVEGLTAALVEHGASVADSRMALLGGEFALMMLVAAPAAGSGGLLETLQLRAENLGLQLLSKPTQSPEAHRAGRVRSYQVEVHALDHPGIVHAFTAAIRGLGGNVVALDTAAYSAAVTGAPLFRMSLSADFAPEITANRLRESLETVSNAVNADLEVRPA